MALPQLHVLPSASKRIQHFDCLVFRDELAAPVDGLDSGAVVELTDPHGTFLGYAFYSRESHIAARVVSLDRARPVDRALIAERLRASIARRAAIRDTDAKRLVFSEADGLPGLIVDQYGEHLVLQSRTAGIEAWKPEIVKLLHQQVHPKGILERSDKEFREEEGLPPLTQVLSGAVPERLLIEESGMKFWVDPYRGHKTGWYLDQRDTRRVVRELIRPSERVADVFAYTGGFGIAAAGRGAQVTCIEREQAWIDLAKEHAELNGVSSQLEWVTGDAFYWLEGTAKRGERFDWVLLDPPGLAKTKPDTQKGRQALHRLLVHALNLLAPHGTLVLSVCSYHLLAITEEIVRIAAEECRARLRVRAMSLQATDHPWILQMPMTRYLTTWILQREEPPAA